MRFSFSIKYRYSVFLFMAFIVECCNRLFCCNQTCYCVGMVSVMSASRYQSPLKVDPLYTTDVDSTILANESVRVG